MQRYLVAFASVLIGVAVTAPYFLMQFYTLPPRPPQAINAPRHQELTLDEEIAIFECGVVFYVVTYFSGRLIYKKQNRQQELAELKEFSGGHVALLHAIAGIFMIASPWLNRPNAQPLNACVNVAIGIVLLGSTLPRITSWTRMRFFHGERINNK